MFARSELATLRRAYARQVVAMAGADDPRLVAALETLRREDFVPPGPWLIGGDGPTPDGDPLYLYQDVVVPILAEKGLNNGQPSFVTRLIAAAGIRAGERLVHVGTGTGYYTAILAHLTGLEGRVVGIEIEPELAAWAGRVLADRPQVEIRAGNGWSDPVGAADVVMVNAGAAGFAAHWLDALPIGGRLVSPLAGQRRGDTGVSGGVVLRLERDADGFAASVVSSVAIYPCIGSKDLAFETRLREALTFGGADRVTRLVRGRPDEGTAAWLVGEDWYRA